MWHDMFLMTIPVADKVLRTIGVYLVIVLLLRLAGKRLMAQMNNLDLVVVLLLSNVVQNAIIGSDNSLLGGVLGAVVLVAVNSVVDRLMHHFPHLRLILQGRGTTVVHAGVLDLRALARLGTTRGEFAAALHRQNANQIEEVDTAVVEPGGDLEVRLKPEDQAASRQDLEAAVTRLEAAIAGPRTAWT